MKNFIKRDLKTAITKASKQFKAILLTGPRQVGKTTLLKEIGGGERSYITLDDMNMRIAAQNDPALFIDRLQLPVLIDEIQYAPQLFPYIKIAVDNQDTPGLFWMTGSQQFEMMKHVSESLAGRLGVFKLQGLSLSEELGREHISPFIPTPDTLAQRQKLQNPINIKDIYYKIWRGSFPELVKNKSQNWEQFYESYVTTYIQKDIREHLAVSDESLFRRFMEVISTRSAQLLNYRDLSKDVGVSEPTVKRWIRALEASGTIYLLAPYFNNKAKRLIKTPKLYFMDTGLCSYLSGWLNPDVLERGAMSGPILETYVISEIVKSYIHSGRVPRIFFYRDKDKKEVDLLIEESGTIYPIEIKKSATIANKPFSGFKVLSNLNVNIGHGCIICFVNNLVPMTDKIDAVPVAYL